MRKLLFFVEGFTDIRFVVGLSEIADLTMCVPAEAYVSSGLKDRVQASGARVQVHEIPGGRLAYQWRSFGWLWRNARAYDAILSQELLRGSLNATIVGALRRVPVMTTMMIAPVEYFRCRRARGQVGPVAAWAAELIIRLLMTINGALSTRCIALGAYLHQVARRYCPRTVPGGYYGVDTSFFSPASTDERTALRRRLDLPEDAFLVFLASRISHEKDPETALRAAAIARDRGLNVVLLNLSGGYRQFVELASRLDLPDADRWVIGRPAAHPMTQLADYYRAADAIVQASLAEGLGLSPLEALACGVPVVATNVGGMTTTLPGYGRLTPVGDAEQMAGELVWIASHRDEAREQALRGREMVRREWSRDKAFADMAAVLDDVTATRGRADRPTTSSPVKASTGGWQSLSNTSRVLLIMILLSLAAARLVTGPHIVDDAYITFRYSEHLAALGRFSYNPSALVLGTTTPLLTLLLAAARALTVDPATASFAIAVASDAVTAWLVALMLAAAGMELAALVAAGLLAISPLVITYAVSGLETSLYSALLTATVYMLSRGSWRSAGLLGALACLCRPDGALLVGVIAVSLGRRRFTTGARFAAIVAAAGLPWLLWSTWYFGSPVPHSVLAKAAQSQVDQFVSLANYVEYFTHGQYGVMSVFALLGIWRLSTVREGAWREWGAWWAVYSTVFIAANALTYFPVYFIPLLPLYFAAVAAGLGLIGERAVSLTRRVLFDSDSIGVPAGTSVALVAILVGGGAARVAHNKHYLDSLEDGRERLYASVASTLASRGPDCVLAATEIGALGYYYPGPILDLVGLVSPEVVGHDAATVLRNSDAQWLVSYDTHLPAAVRQSEWFSQEFTRQQRIPVSASRALEVYERTGAHPCTTAGRVAAREAGAR